MTTALSTTRFRAFWLWFPLCWLLLAAMVCAADVSVKAGLDRAITVIGEPVQLQIKIINAKRDGEPPEIPSVDGLDFHYAGKDGSWRPASSGNIVQERVTMHIYQVTPEKNGTFTIPEIEVEVDGRKFKTTPLTVTVQQSSVDDGSKPRAQGTLEIIVPKTTAYVGEMIPAELRLYVDARVRWQPVAMPSLEGEGFTRQKFPEPRRPEVVTKNGRDYDVLIFKTAITPSKAGKLDLGPAEILYNAQVPRARRAGPKSLMDIFDDDMMGDPFFAQTQPIKLTTKPVELTVKPLPVAGRPAGFSGAVGQFEFSATGTPSQVKMGDPVTMKLRVAGHGNFDRVEAPVLKDPRGWRSYPPSNVFVRDASDELGVSGAKNFEMAVIPEERKTQMPAYAFSYFDPVAEKYVTLSSDPAPLQVEGTVKVPVPVARTNDSPTPQATPAAAPAPEAGDIRGVVDEPGVRRSFQPLYERREFWYGQAVPAAAFLGFMVLRLRQPRSATVLRATALRRERVTLLARLRGGKLTYTEFFEAAARVLQIDTGLAKGADASSMDVEAVRNLARDSTVAEVIDEIFNARAELLFAGGSHVETGVSAETKTRVLATLETFGRSHAKG